jgi:hypothetical protein
MVDDRPEYVRHGNLSGRDYVASTGRLPEPWSRAIRAARDARTLAYVISSYATPIAWAEREQGSDRLVWTVPPASYSVSTTNHQNVLRSELAGAGYTSRNGCVTYTLPARADVSEWVPTLAYDPATDRLTTLPIPRDRGEWEDAAAVLTGQAAYRPDGTVDYQAAADRLGDYLSAHLFG